MAKLLMMPLNNPVYLNFTCLPMKMNESNDFIVTIFYLSHKIIFNAWLYHKSIANNNPKMHSVVQIQIVN